jgi:hypothetical protein
MASIEGAKPRCQCIATCKLPPLPNSPFCKKHIRYCPRKAPLSGYEPEFNPSRYNKTRRIKDSHNCFAYALNHMDPPPQKDCNEKMCITPFHQPGRTSGYPKWSKVTSKRCPDIISRLFADIPDIKLSTFEKKCPKGTSKIALVVDEDEDYHFFRQDSNTKWSHKPGSTNVTDLDGSNRPIYDPALAKRDNRYINYDRFCGYLCAPRTKRLKLKRGGKRKTRKL